jgi:hypothetical protein
VARAPFGKPKRTGTKLLVGLLLLVPAVYVAVQLATIAGRSSALLTQTAVLDTMAESVVCEGFLGMTEQSITYEGSGVLSYIARNGERVSEGIGVARLFASEADAAEYKRYTALSQEIELLTKAQATGSVGDASLLEKQVQTGVYDALDALDSGDFSSLEVAQNNIQLAQDKLRVSMGEMENYSARISELTARRDALNGAAGTVITAPGTGYFVSSQESTAALFTPEQLAEMTPVQLQEALQQPVQENPENCAGKIISDYRWRFFALVDAEQAEKFSEGTDVTVSFPKVSQESVPASIVSIQLDEEAGIAKVELLCDYINSETVALEREQAVIALRTYMGLRIPTRACHTVNGKTYVYTKLGNMVHQKPVTVLWTDGENTLISPEYIKDENELEMYDEVIVEGTGLYNGKLL